MRPPQSHAERNSLPVDFFTRLIWKESIFDAQAVSPVGAEGIAQFMPGTAKLRGLKNSFDHREALAAAADYLAFLTEKFGNLGLAAAAYNFGEDGTSAWLQIAAPCPLKPKTMCWPSPATPQRNGAHPATALDIPGLGGSGSFTENCTRLVLRELLPPSPATQRSPTKPWGVVIAGGFSEAQYAGEF